MRFLTSTRRYAIDSFHPIIRLCPTSGGHASSKGPAILGVMTLAHCASGVVRGLCNADASRVADARWCGGGKRGSASKCAMLAWIGTLV
eukprot:860680-Rhodomonas_salina.1